MGIKLSSAEKEPLLDVAAQHLRGTFVSLFNGLLAILRNVVLPHMLGSFILFMLAAVALYKTQVGLPAPLSWIFIFPTLGCTAVILLVYGIVASVLFSVHSAACQVEDFLYALFASVKERVQAQIETMDEGLAKQQAKVILDNSVREVFAPLRALKMGRVPAAIAGVFLSLMTFVTRSVFLARLARVSASTVQFSKVFASRATLIGALFLNLRWLSALLLGFLYILGIIFLALCIYIMW